jgi:hypothetical protein
MLKYLFLWIPMLLIAIFNGSVKSFGYKTKLGGPAAHVLSAVSLLLLFALYIACVIRLFSPASPLQAIEVGIMWMVLTLAFEFALGRWLGRSFGILLSDYRFERGYLWILVPLWVAIAPYLFYSMSS